MPLADYRIILLDQAHQASSIGQIIAEYQPTELFIGVSRWQLAAFIEPELWQNSTLAEVIKSGRWPSLLLDAVIFAYRKRLAKISSKQLTRPEIAMAEAFKIAIQKQLDCHLIDQPLRLTIAQASAQLSFKEKLQLLQVLFLEASLRQTTISDQTDLLSAVINELCLNFPQLRAVLVDQRNSFMLNQIDQLAHGKRTLVLVSATNFLGLEQHLQKKLPPPGKPAIKLKKRRKLRFWLMVLLSVGLVSLLIYGFSSGNKELSGQALLVWILANSIPAGLGALIAFGHPFSILSAMISAPITSLHPLINAGWVSGLVELYNA